VANTKSAIKRIRTNERRRVRNRTIRSHVRSAVKTARAAGGDALRTAVAIDPKAVGEIPSTKGSLGG